ncbi:MAG: ImmA/IrrE family metallo-endopeptidase [Candidatus Binatia bacterium]
MINQSAVPNHTFIPDWVSPPGDSILDMIEERGWTQDQLADRLGYSAKHVNQLIKGKVPLTEDAATRLQSVLGASVGFWLKREALYRERAALLAADDRHTAMVPWLDKLPVKELMDIGAILPRRIDARSKPGIVGELLSFFGVASPDQWESNYGEMALSFRRSRSDQTDVGAISSWLRLGERLAEKLDGPRYDESRFRSALTQVRALTRAPAEQFASQLRQLFHDSGVALVIVPAVPRARVSGVARWLNPHRPLVQLSLSGKTNDKFWFTLFHEAAHILLHANQKKTVFLDDASKSSTNSLEEQEANAWASNFLIPAEYANALIQLPKTRAAVCSFASTVGVHEGVIVGRLQHDHLMDVTWLNDLKVSFTERDLCAV